MKGRVTKKLRVLLILVLVLSLCMSAGCGGKSKTKKPASDKTELFKETVAAPTAAPETEPEAPEKLGKEELATIGPAYTSIFRMRNACFVEPTALQVGVARAKRLENKLVLFGFVQLGEFKKGDSVLILDGNQKREATVLEAYVFDPDVPENDLEVMLKAHMGKQCLNQWQEGWLVLDDQEKVGGNTTVIV